MMRPGDRILSAPRGDSLTAIQFADRFVPQVGLGVMAETAAYISAVYRLAPMAGIDPAIVVAQSAEETGNWTDDNWTKRRNPAGIGVTDSHDFGYSWPDGAAAARGHLAHLYLYVRGYPHSDWEHDDPRQDALIASGWAGTVRTIADLTHKWATDDRYGEKVAARGNAIFPSIPDQEDSKPVPLTIDVELVNRGFGKLRDRDAWITVHNNGNPNSDRFDERAFVAAGGGAEGVAYHFAVDAGGAMQIMALDTRGIHAGNLDGNATSIAIEMCVGSEPWSQVKENTAQLLAAIMKGDDRLVFGTGAYRFSLDRIKEHRQWPGANPACPARLIQTDGGAGTVIARAKELTGGGTMPDMGLPEGMDRALAEKWFGKKAAGGHTYSFNPDGPVSKLWIAHGRETGSWPKLAAVETYDVRRYFRFADGFTLFVANDGAEPVVLR